jgi:hypothetical protein
MNDYIPSGGFTIARKLFISPIWTKDPLYLKIWIWLIGKANHSEQTKNGYLYKRGEVVTTYSEIVKALSYAKNHKNYVPTIKQIRVMLQWLKDEGMILPNPIKTGLGRTGADTRVLTGAYIGIKIKVINYDSYQNLENYKGRHRGRDLSEQGQYNNNDYKNDNNPVDFFSLRKRYSDPQLIDDVFKAIASTRKSNKVSDSVLIALLKKLNDYPADQVESGIRVYLQKRYADENKDEKYLLGIIRNQKIPEPKHKSSGSSLLDLYYATNAN